MLDAVNVKDFLIERSACSCTMPSMHYHYSYELYYLEQGQRDYFIEDKFFTVSAGEFVLIPPGKLHRTGGKYGTRILIYFAEDFLRQAYTESMAEYLLKCFDNWLLIPDLTQRRICVDLLEEIEKTANIEQRQLLLGMLLLELSKCKKQELVSDRQCNIVAYINKHFAEIRNIEEIAERFFISKYYLCRIFRDNMQMTITEYINEVRIKYACELLDSGETTVSLIAEKCGFGSPSYFAKVFKKKMGKTPLEYREKK